MDKTIGVIGLWHLGCVLCASWYKLDNSVVGFDYDNERVKNLNQGIPPLFEPNLKEVIQEGLNTKSLCFSNQMDALSDCEFIFLSYDTPVREDDTSDTCILEKAVNDVRQIMKNGSVLIVSSQSPVGFCSILRNLLKKDNDTLELVYSPENLRLGEAIECYLHPERIILGTAKGEAESKCIDLFSQITDEIIKMNLESSEIVKHGINSFLSTSIVFANHLSDVCEMTGARIDDVVRGMKSDVRIGQKAYLSPGIGFSGGTLGRDLKVLDKKNLEKSGYAKLFGLVHQLNDERKFSIVNRIERLIGSSDEEIVGVLGLTYKPGTSTLRRSMPLEIVNLLMEKGYKVKAYDPKADYDELSEKPRFTVTSDIYEAADSVDMLVLFTEWEDFKECNWHEIPKTMNNPIFYDTKNFLDEEEMISYGFKYYSIGN